MEGFSESSGGFDLSRLRVQLPLVMPGPRVRALRRTFVPLGPAQGVGLGIQQRVESVFHRAATISPSWLSMAARSIWIILSGREDFGASAELSRVSGRSGI